MKLRSASPYDHFEIKLNSGIILGPISYQELRGLIIIKQIIGTELARKHPDGQWQDINSYELIAELLLKQVQDKLSEASRTGETLGISGPEFPSIHGSAKTIPLPDPQVTVFKSSGEKNEEIPKTALKKKNPRGQKKPSTSSQRKDTQKETPDDVSKTEILMRIDGKNPPKTPTPLTPPASQQSDVSLAPVSLENSTPHRQALGKRLDEFGVPFSQRETIVLDRSKLNRGPGLISDSKKKSVSGLKNLKLPLFVVLLGFLLFESEPTKPSPEKALLPALNPALPRIDLPKKDPQISTKLYQEGMRFYLEDTELGYREALKRFSLAVSLDNENLKANAMLVSCYLNLVESSSKDQKYFAVVSKLMELLDSKNIELPEKTIAKVEYFQILNQTEVAESQIVEYTKTHPSFGLEMFFYLASVLFQKGQIQLSANYLSQISDDKAFSPKVFYLRGLLAEKVNDVELAQREFQKAIKKNKNHVRSRLKIVEYQLNSKSNLIKEAALGIQILFRDLRLFAPKELAFAYYLRSKYYQIVRNFEMALGDIEKATQLDRDHQKIFEEYYYLFAKLGGNIENVRKVARMFHYMNEGEKFIKEGNIQEALVQLMQARQEAPKSPLPPLKIGDMFYRMHDLGSAKINYKVAADLSPKDVDVWSKYLDVLIQSFEWKEAEEVMKRFRSLKVNQSSLDKAAGDIFLKQGRIIDAQANYRIAMGRRAVDQKVYSAYGDSLVLLHQFKEASFFYSMALKFDPLNAHAVIGIAKSIAGSESIDRAIAYLQEELKLRNGVRAELLSSIAEFQIQKGSYDDAKIYIDEAKTANPDLATPWRLQALVHLNEEPPTTFLQKKGPSKWDKALEAFQRYSDRNISDPTGYLERYQIFIRQQKFDKAEMEINKIYGVFPKYPNLHYYKGLLYSYMGNHKVSVDELKLEVENNPSNIVAIIKLGMELVILGQTNDALVHFNRAMELDPSSSEAKHQAGFVNFLLKDYNKAIILLQAASLIDTGNPLLFKRLGIAFQEVGKKKEAAAAFRKYVELDPEASDRATYERFMK